MIRNCKIDSIKAQVQLPINLNGGVSGSSIKNMYDRQVPQNHVPRFLALDSQWIFDPKLDDNNGTIGSTCDIDNTFLTSIAIKLEDLADDKGMYPIVVNLNNSLGTNIPSNLPIEPNVYIDYGSVGTADTTRIINYISGVVTFTTPVNSSDPFNPTTNAANYEVLSFHTNDSLGYEVDIVNSRVFDMIVSHLRCRISDTTGEASGIPTLEPGTGMARYIQDGMVGEVFGVNWTIGSLDVGPWWRAYHSLRLYIGNIYSERSILVNRACINYRETFVIQIVVYILLNIALITLVIINFTRFGSTLLPYSSINWAIFSLKSEVSKSEDHTRSLETFYKRYRSKSEMIL